jgi:hypothetical protein
LSSQQPGNAAAWDKQASVAGYTAMYSAAAAAPAAGEDDVTDEELLALLCG